SPGRCSQDSSSPNRPHRRQRTETNSRRKHAKLSGVYTPITEEAPLPDWKYNPMLRTLVTRLGDGYWRTKLPALRLQLAAHDLTRKDAEHKPLTPFLSGPCRASTSRNHTWRVLWPKVSSPLPWSGARAVASAWSFAPPTFSVFLPLLILRDT